MTNPLKPDGEQGQAKPSNPEKQGLSDAQPEQEKEQQLSLSDIMAPKLGDSNRHFKVPGANIRIGGLEPKPFFQPKKSEFRSVNEEKTTTRFKPLVDKFLKETPEKEDVSLSPAEKHALDHTRKALSQSNSVDEIRSNALHLAKLYQHLKYIEEAKKATELSLGIDPNSMLSKEVFKELERSHPIDIGLSEAVAAQYRLTKSALRRRIRAFAQGKIVVLGDMLIDELLEGRPERISREAPVLVLEHVDTVLIPGGAANTAHNIASLGGGCHAIGVCGRDQYASKLMSLLDQHGITHSLVEDTARPTTVKTRILSKSHSLMQQLLRLDRISHTPIDIFTESKLIDKMAQVCSQHKAVILSDYRSGVITDSVIHAVRQQAGQAGLDVIVDAQERFERFQGCTLITPNQPDVEQAVGFPITNKEELKAAGEKLQTISGAKSVLITRGGEGMALFEKGRELFELPAFNRSDVFDVTGAGDTVVAVLTLAISTGSSLAEAMALGNLAASIVVRKPGTAVTDQTELLENLERLNLPE